MHDVTTRRKSLNVEVVSRSVIGTKCSKDTVIDYPTIRFARNIEGGVWQLFVVRWTT
jgi:hypothetical protein